MLHQRIVSEQQSSLTEMQSSSYIVEEDATYSSNLLARRVSGVQKVLGVSWNTVDDKLDFDIREIATSLQAH